MNKPRQDRITGRPVLSGRLPMAAFTLIELLVVMAIIGLLAAIGLPAIKGFGKGTGMAGAERQLLDDLGLARLRAIGGRTTVYVVFVPPGITGDFPVLDGSGPPSDRNRWLRQFTNLISGQFTAYALVAKRTLGDQPGRDTPHYLSEWKRLPQGILIPPNKFDQTTLTSDPAVLSFPPDYKRAFSNDFLPFPASRSPLSAFPLPYIAFNAQGQLLFRRDELIPLAEGSVFFQKDASGKYAFAPPDVVIKPSNNYTNHYIRVNWLTGRASVDELTRPKFP